MPRALVAAIDEESPEERVGVRRRGLGHHDEPAQLAFGLDRPEPRHDPPAAFVELGRECVGERLVDRGDEPLLGMVRRQAADVSAVTPVDLDENDVFRAVARSFEPSAAFVNEQRVTEVVAPLATNVGSVGRPTSKRRPSRSSTRAEAMFSGSSVAHTRCTPSAKSKSMTAPTVSVAKPSPR